MEGDTQGYDQRTNMPLKLLGVGQSRGICVFSLEKNEERKQENEMSGPPGEGRDLGGDLDS